MSSEPLTAEQIEELKKRHIRSFCMRRGHISNAQEKALEELLPLYEIPYDANQKFDAVKTFGNNNPLVLEIGCGMGETTAAIAQAHPEINFIGCEVFAAGVGALSKRLHDIDLKNVRIFRHDAVEVVRDMLEDESLDGVHIFFPDPWRKARHHKRRLINDLKTPRSENEKRRLFPLRYGLGKLRRADGRSAFRRTYSEKPP